MLLELPEFYVSRETDEKLKIYDHLLRKWQKTINLVSPSTLGQAQTRHFTDSLQLACFVTKDTILYDIGSGAGFPGLVLANFCNVHLIESDQRKCQFLQNVSREANIPVIIHNARVENVDVSPPDIVTARALSSLTQLLIWTEQWWQKNKNIKLLFLKGRNAETEIKNARNEFNFSCETFQSTTDDQGCILLLTGIERIP